MTDSLMASSIDGNEYPVDGELKWRPSVYGIIIQDDKILLSPQFGIGGELSTIGFDEAEKKYAQLAEWIECDEFNDKTPIASTVDFRPVVLKIIEEIKQ